MKLQFVFILLFLLSSSSSTTSITKHSVVGDNAAFITSDEYDNGYPVEKYHSVLDTFIKIYSPVIARRGGTFHILRDFKDGSVNAWAWRIADEYHLEVPGGMSKYYLISEEGFITTICHEIGHLLGGSPTKGRRGNISVEGQSDYFSTSKCLERMLAEITPYQDLKVDEEVERICTDSNSQNCRRALNGMKSLTSYYAKIEKVEFPSLFKDSPRVVRSTLKTHPKSQCRLDTMKRAYFCPVDRDEEFSFEDQKIGACHLNYFPEFARPKCWYRE